MNENRISRRRFLKSVGVAGMAMGLGGGLSGLLAGCTQREPITNTTATAGIVPATPTTAAPTTTVSTGPEIGREIRLALVSAATGPLALFSKADEWWVDYALGAVPEGIVGGDNKQHMVKIERVDSRSDPKRAAQVAGDLVTNAGVDLMMASGSPDTANPVADQCEALGQPFIASFVPWQPFYFGRGATPDRPFKWTYAQALGLESIVANFIAMWEQVQSNKRIGFLLANDADGAAWRDISAGLPPAVEAAGYTYYLPDPYPIPTNDFNSYISDFKREGCEICCGIITAPDFISFWKQAVRQGYNPKAVTMGKALLFPYTLEATGDIAYHTTGEAVWHPSWPFKDSITGKSCRELAEDYMAKTGEQWTAPIGQYAKFEWAVDVFKRVRDLDDKEDIIDKVRTTKLGTCLGAIDFTEPVGRQGGRHVVENVYRVPAGGTQWVKGDTLAFEPVMVSNALAPELPVTASVRPMSYTA